EAHQGQGMHHSFADVERFARIFDDPGRDAWQKPEKVVGLLGNVAGQTLVDLGAGTGYFLPYLSAAAGAEGRVIALDVEPNMVAHMEARIAEAELGNVSVKRCPPDAPGLPAASADVVLVVDTWHHFPDREAYVGRLKDVLRPGGRVLVIDFTLEAPMGPPPAMRLPARTVARELASAGLPAEVLEETLPHQYAVLATAPLKP
ncbi:MAG: class I SAM-dependent methyltransferase, partial [Myxococcota bacterium]